MATLFNQIVCAQTFGNTGFGDCILIPDKIKGLFIVPKNFRITEANISTLQTVLQTAARNTSKSLRIYPVHNFDGITDNSEEDVYQTTGYGSKNFSREGEYDWLFSYSEGGSCVHNALRSFPVKGVYVIFYDEQNVLYGWNLSGEMAGIPLTLFKAQKMKIADGTNPSQYFLKTVFQAPYLNEESMYLKADFMLSEVQGLKDVELFATAAQTVAATYEVGARTKCSQVDLYDSYADDLADDTLWTAKDEDGNAIDLVSVAKNDALNGWTIVVDSADTDYPSVAAKVYFNLASPTTLNTAGIENVESTAAIGITRAS